MNYNNDLKKVRIIQIQLCYFNKEQVYTLVNDDACRQSNVMHMTKVMGVDLPRATVSHPSSTERAADIGAGR